MMRLRLIAGVAVLAHAGEAQFENPYDEIRAYGNTRGKTAPTSAGFIVLQDNEDQAGAR